MQNTATTYKATTLPSYVTLRDLYLQSSSRQWRQKNHKDNQNNTEAYPLDKSSLTLPKKKTFLKFSYEFLAFWQLVIHLELKANRVM